MSAPGEYLTAVVDCGNCGESFEGSWAARGQDQEEIPAAAQCCPYCGNTQLYAYPGWSYFTEAG